MPAIVTYVLEEPVGPLARLLATTRSTRTQVEDLISQPDALGPDFTPIRRLTDNPRIGEILGWKATGRGKPGTDVADTLALLDEARRLGLVERLDWAFRAHTFDVAQAAGLQTELHLTPEPETFGTPCPPRLAVSFLRGRQALSVAAELHDDAFDDHIRLRQAVEQMREWGWRIVLTDLPESCVPYAIESLEWLRPTYVHLDVSEHSEPTELQTVAQRGGAALIAVRVDDHAGLQIARSVGADYIRGDLAGPTRPTPC